MDDVHLDLTVGSWAGLRWILGLILGNGNRARQDHERCPCCYLRENFL
jgi:hypothetical protein